MFLYKILNSKRGIPQRNVFEVLPAENIEAITLGSLKFGTWFWSTPSYTADIVSLCFICQIVKPKITFEVGTYKGYTAYHFALNTPADTKVYTLDLPKGEKTTPKLKTTAVDDIHIVGSNSTPELYHFDSTCVASKITCLFSDSATFDYSTFHGLVDFFFIDGAHSYEYVHSDPLNAFKCCHPGSVIVWHDFGRVGVNGVSKWILELSKEYEIYSIPGGSLAFMMMK